ncbi:MAG: tRNA uridine-5-carboxymethylaminomethyl(34) synthesis GTPase MnmE [Acidobacteriota bacterium]|jgi:tRNA modification GTPase
MSDLSDTICALSTATGRSGIAVVRVSGSRSFEIYRKIFHHSQPCDKVQPRISILGRIEDPRNGNEIDNAVSVCYAAPKSYTGEDVTEFSIHGSPVLVAALLDCICAAGARLAEPGEFTMRAFLHGKMDLTQAESVKDIIDSTTLFQAQVASRQRTGEISKSLQPLKTLFTDIIVQLESAVEFVEEDLSLDTRAVLTEKMTAARKDIRKWIDTYRQGRIVRDGFSMAIIGRPNVGKSSLFNALLKQDRSIVMDLPGTTRDMVSEFTSIGGVPVKLLDTAGLHTSSDSTENIGIDRTYQAISDADAILIVLDRSQPSHREETEFKSVLSRLQCIVVMNKNDLESRWTREDTHDFAGEWPWIEVSAKFGDGIDKLRALIFEQIFGAENLHSNSLLISNLRHCHSLEAIEEEIILAENALNEGLSEEFALVHLHRGFNEMGVITGETSVEDILIEIFSRFCIGK